MPILRCLEDSSTTTAITSRLAPVLSRFRDDEHDTLMKLSVNYDIDIDIIVFYIVYVITIRLLDISDISIKLLLLLLLLLDHPGGSVAGIPADPMQQMQKLREARAVLALKQKRSGRGPPSG